MGPMTGCSVALCLLLAGAGVLKVRRPAATTRALADLELPGGNALALFPVARLLGVAEVALAAVGIWVGGRVIAGAVAVVYLAFAGVAYRLSRTAADCGCFGEARSPLGPTHVAVDLIFAGTAALGLYWPPTGLGRGPVTDALLMLGAGAVLAGLGYLIFTSFPALLRVRASVEAR